MYGYKHVLNHILWHSMDNIVCGRCSVSQIMQFSRCIFSKYLYISRHLKLEIALAIPASNE